MTERVCDWTEQEIVDVALGRKSADIQLLFQQHRQTCPRCEELFDQWIGLLENRAVRLVAPSSRLKANMKISFLRHRLRSAFRRRRKTVLAAVSAAAFAGLVLFTLASFHQTGGTVAFSGVPSDGEALAKQSELMTRMAFLVQPETHHYTVAANAPSAVKGYIWVNDASNEMLMLVDGLKPSEWQDYQAWLTAENRQINGGLLLWDYGRAHLYLKGNPIGALRHISVSIEPKGGSEAPSGPRALDVSLPEKN